MNHETLATDYLVIGGGAIALAFVDTLLDVSDADIVVVDRHDRPGGHWNDAYPFVRLHQHSAWYGVASRPIVQRDPDPSGYGRGASGAEVLAYFDALMRERFLPSGRVRWFAQSEVRRGADGVDRIVSLRDGSAKAVAVRCKRVDATHARTEVPSTHGPRYGVAPGVALIAPNRLPTLDGTYPHYTVVGAGKTGMDSALWLLDQGVAPSRIRWIVPRDAWLHDRAQLRSGAAHFEASLRSTLREFDAIAAATSIDELLARLEADGLLLRLDPAVTPTMYRCAVTSQGELAQLRRIADVVRLGRVRRIEPSQLLLERGSLDAPADTLYIDCSASALQPPPARPVFDGDTIHLLMIQACRPLFSAALIARVECLDADADEKNALATPVPSPVQPSDWLRLRALTLVNAQRWSRQPEIKDWLRSCRLDLVATLLGGRSPDDPAVRGLLRERALKVQAAAANLPRLLATLHRQAAVHRADRAAPPVRAARTREPGLPVELA